MLDNLLFYAGGLNWKIFPCSTADKRPLVAHGFKDATNDPKQIEEWYRQYPGCAWGTPTSSTAGVFEYDKRHDPSGEIWRERVEGKPLPATWKSMSGGGSPHVWLRWPGGTRSSEIFNSALGRKADGGYVIIPPSKVTTHAGPYRWLVRPWETAIAEAPDWLVELFAKPGLKSGSTNLKSEAEADPWVVKEAKPDLLTHPGADKSKGEQRRPTLVKLIGCHLARGDNPATIEALVKLWADKCNPPLSDDEWRPHLEGLSAKDEALRLTRTTKSKVVITEITGGEEEEVWASTSSSPPAATFQEESDVCVSSGTPDNFPRLPKAAYYGLLGEMLSAVEPETEADPAAVLLGWLATVGDIVGRGAWCQVGAGRHYPALFAAAVGVTSAAKGDAWKVTRWPFAETEPDWSSTCICPGVGSGEGLVERVADEQRTMVFNKKTGLAEEQLIPGAADKRCLLRLSELSRLFKMQRRENNPLSEILREAWDGEIISIPNRKGNSLSTAGYTISVVGDITPGAIRKLLEVGTEAFDGFANRFLWAAVQSDKSLPHGGNVSVLNPYLPKLQDALTWAKNAGELQRDAEANQLWESVYDGLKSSGDVVPHTDRARPHVVRLSLLFALLDKSRVIKANHLSAALAVWDYCRESARLIFGGPEQSQPDPLWLEVLNALPADGTTVERWRLNEKFKRKVSAENVGDALENLKRNGMAECVKEATGGRVGEKWRRLSGDTHHTPITQSATAGGEEEEVSTSTLLGGEEEEVITSATAGGEEEEEEVRVEAQTSSSPPPSFSPTSFRVETSSSPPPSSAEKNRKCDGGVSPEMTGAERGLL